MANIFPKSANAVPAQVIAALTLVVLTTSALAYFYLTPDYANKGYMPRQPVAYSHELHVGQLGLDCRYCHDNVDKSEHAKIPDAATCMNCHSLIKTDSPALEPIRRSYNTGEPVAWIKIHKTPDYVYFNHAVHVNRGVSCVECHGRVDQMKEVYQAKSLTMGFCLDCHMNPTDRVRPNEQVTNLAWQADKPQSSLPLAERMVEKHGINPPISCSGCHR